jgi:hypothetical protein
MQCSAAQHTEYSAKQTQRSTTQLSAGVCDRRRLREGGRETFFPSPVWFVRFWLPIVGFHAVHTYCRPRCFRAGMLPRFGRPRACRLGRGRRVALLPSLAAATGRGVVKVMDGLEPEMDMSSERLIERRLSKDMTSQHTIYMKRVR